MTNQYNTTIRGYITTKVFCSRSMFSSNATTIRFAILQDHLMVQILFNCKLKVKLFPLKLSFLWSSSSKTDLFYFLYCIVSGTQNFLYWGGLYRKKLNGICCLKTSTKLLSITLPFNRILSNVLKFKILSLVCTLGLSAWIALGGL